ncbi:hypothetical protein EDD59_10612 [Muricomes intestini]|uniref:Uncharacterized protein n=1 Tax=Muricomes intestini TaxID=1796634 RepID=A0A4R3KB84_9FIRM|nr:hypothetical protein [Muricomes intestini]TCS80189.1 hypothetical protein EDD59_10612 [Muricomes intestini]
MNIEFKNNIASFNSLDEQLSILSTDPKSDKIYKRDRLLLIEKAEAMGRNAAKNIISDSAWKENPTLVQYIEDMGIKIIHEDKDFLVKDIRYCAEIYPKKKSIYLYDRAIKKWARDQGYNVETAETFILAHEFYHYIEFTNNNFASNLYSTPIIKIRRVEIGKSGIMKLSEIAGNAFAYELF